MITDKELNDIIWQLSGLNGDQRKQFLDLLGDSFTPGEKNCLQVCMTYVHWLQNKDKMTAIKLSLAKEMYGRFTVAFNETAD